MIRPPNLRAALDSLVRRGELSREARAHLLETDQRRETEHTPWYVRLLIGVGAWISAGMFLPFIGQLMASKTATLFAGITLITLTIFARRNLKHPFWVQLALACCLAGQGLVLNGVRADISSLTIQATLVLSIQLVLLFTYPDTVMRFLATVGSAGAMLAIAFDSKKLLPVDLVVILVMTAGAYFWLLPQEWRKTWWSDLRLPVAYGLLISGLGTLGVHQVISSLSSPEPWLLLWPTTIGLGIAWLALSLYVWHDYENATSLRPNSLVFVIVLAVCAKTLMNPGIIASLGMFGLAFQRRSSTLLGIACVFLSSFLFFFYYNQQATLLVKSGMLVVTGSALIFLRFMLRRHWQRITRNASTGGRND